MHSTKMMSYGGNTTCIEIDAGQDFFLVIDAGSGLSNLQKSIVQSPNRKKLHLLITHSHWDHVLSLPYLQQFQDPSFQIDIYAPDVGTQPFSEIFKMLLKKGRLPIKWEKPKCKLNFHRTEPSQTFLIEGKVKVSTFQVNHQHVTLAYKFGLPDGSLAIVTDIAILNQTNILGQGMLKRADEIGAQQLVVEYESNLVNFLRGIDSVVFDTHFNESNLRIDWGHATPLQALQYCSKAGIKRLFMFHHAPDDDDQTVAQKQDSARHHELALLSSIEVINAREEDEWLIQSA